MHTALNSRNVVSIWNSCRHKVHHRMRHTDALGSLALPGRAERVRKGFSWCSRAFAEARSLTCMLQILKRIGSPRHPAGAWHLLNCCAIPPSQDREHVDQSDQEDHPVFFVRFSNSSPSGWLSHAWPPVWLPIFDWSCVIDETKHGNILWKWTSCRNDLNRCVGVQS